MIKAQRSFVAQSLQYIIPPIRIKSSTGRRLISVLHIFWLNILSGVKGWKLLQGTSCEYKAQHTCAHLIHTPAWRLPTCSSTCVPVSSHFIKVETWAWMNDVDSFTDNYTKIQYVARWALQILNTCVKDQLMTYRHWSESTAFNQILSLSRHTPCWNQGMEVKSAGSADDQLPAAHDSILL